MSGRFGAGMLSGNRRKATCRQTRKARLPRGELLPVGRTDADWPAISEVTMTEYITTYDSVEKSLEGSFEGTIETNIRFSRFAHYKNGYGADLKKVYFVDKVKLVGVMFCHPDSELGSKQILPRLEYLNYRSGEHTDLFWAGYGPFMKEHMPPGVRPVRAVGGTMWGFDEAEFVAFCREVEGRTTWKYSGETDLLLMTARFNEKTSKPYLDVSEALVCDLDKMIRQGAISTVPRFLEDVFRFGESAKSNDVYDFSDLKLLENSKRSFRDWLLDLLKIKGFFDSTEPFAIRDISRR